MKKALVVLSIFTSLFLSACGGNGGTSGGDATSTATNSPAATGGTASDAGADFPAMEIIFSHNQPIGSPEHTGAEKFKQVVEEKTGGKVKVSVFPASQLGSLREQAEATQMGEINITMQPTAVVTPFVDDVKVVDLPYLWPADKDKPIRCSTVKWARNCCPSCPKAVFMDWVIGPADSNCSPRKMWPSMHRLISKA